MGHALTDDDLLPLVAKLSRGEKVRLARLALRAAGPWNAEAAAYLASPPGADEFLGEDDALGWEAEGWEGTGRCWVPGAARPWQPTGCLDRRPRW